MARGHEHGHYCQAAWQCLWLHSAIKLLGGRVQFGDMCATDVVCVLSYLGFETLPWGCPAAWRSVCNSSYVSTRMCWHVAVAPEQ